MLIRHSAVYLVGRGVPGLISFVALVLFSRLLTPEEYGRYALVLAGVGLLDVLLLQWLRLGLIRYLPSDRFPRQALVGTVLKATMRMAAMATALGALALVFVRPDRATWSLLVTGAIVLWLQAFFELNQEYARSELAPARYGLASVTRASLALCAGAGLVLLGWGALGPLAGLAIAFAVPLVGYTVSGGLPWVVGTDDPALLRTLIRYGAPLALTAALGLVVSSSDRFLLAWLIDEGAAGRYALGYDFAQFTLGMLMMVVNLAAYPLAVRALEREGVGAAREQLRRNFVLLLGVAAPAATGMALLAPNLSGVFLGSAFQSAAAQLVPWIAFAALLGGIKAFYVDLAFQLGQRTMGQVWVMAAAAVVNLALNVAWIPRYGLEGAVYATVVAYIIALVTGWWSARRAFPLPSPSFATLPVLAATAIMALALLAVREWTGPYELAAQVAVGGGVYVVALAVTMWPVLRSRRRSRPGSPSHTRR